MSSDTREQGSPIDIIKWLIVITLLAAAIIGNQYFQDQILALRVAGILGLLAVAVVIAITTVKGKAAFLLVKDANIERKKVVWPTRQETIKTTIVVAIFVTIMALFLWLVDYILINLVGFLTGQ